MAKEVISRLQLLGIDEFDIRKSMYNLYNENGVYSSCIEIHDENQLFIKSPEDIRDSSFLRIMPRGKVLIGKIGNTFGYLFECLRFHDQSINQITTGSHPEVNVSKSLKALIPLLCEIAEMHCKSLKMILEVNEAIDFYTYIEYFGLPQRKSTNTTLSGYTVKGRKYCLQFQAIIGTIIRYGEIKTHRYSNYIEQLEIEFNKVIQGTIDGKEMNLDFKELIDWIE